MIQQTMFRPSVETRTSNKHSIQYLRLPAFTKVNVSLLR
jgi:hypothetical protein